MGPPNEQHQHYTVSDLIDPVTKDWDISKVRLVLPEYEAAILSIKPSLTCAPDKLVWLGTKSGDYTTKSGYFTEVNKEDWRDVSPLTHDFKWKNRVWNLPCAPKVKLFSWKLLKGAVPVGERLVERHVQVDPLCRRCGCSESIVHLLFQCQFAQRVWQLAPFTTELDVRGILDLMNSWETLCSLKCLPPAGVTSGTLVPWVLWSIWKARNKFVFEGHSSSPEDTLSTAIALAREWDNEAKKESSTRQRKSPPHELLPPSVVVVRSDAAWSSETAIAGLGWVILSNAGNSPYKITTQCVSSPLLAEGLALREAVRTCTTLGMKTVTFQSDSAQLIKAVNLETIATELYSVVADISSFCSAFEFVSFSWIPREWNDLADRLAKDALNVAGTLVVGDAFIAPN